ncbi:uncharacterized protein K02A2.6-like [Dermacentor silvarum]|uniref:uncharacterized protein K02A2.6-like n=1 Tax=Dermacentor silvarum TaxID=543639 RepID=UPI0021019EE2|nr:uncharacterized protein K02A2.6-like [Dermacentor silvarum]
MVSEEIDRLVNEGLLSLVTSSEWATPLVPVVKKDGQLRLCGDFRLTVNAATLKEQYPLPWVDNIVANLNGGEVFSTLDLRNAYNQLPLDEDSKKLGFFNIHKGLHCFNRLAFGVSSAPAIFQRRMEAVLSEIPGVQIPALRPETGRKWYRVHIDYAGLVKGHMLLVVVDAKARGHIDAEYDF